MKTAIDEGREILEQAVAALHSALKDRLLSVVLFGSRARDDALPVSDWDLLVIAADLPEKAFKRHFFLRQMLPPGPCDAISLLAKTPGEFEANVPSVYLDIALDAQILYDPSGYAAKKLKALRQLIDRLGLYRERTEAGDVWRWHEKPPAKWQLAWEQ